MHSLRFVSVCLISALLLVLAAFLLEPTRQLLANYKGSSLGPGALPAVCLGGVSLLTVYIFFLELRLFLHSRALAEDPGQAEASLGLPLRDFLRKSVTALSLLWLYILVWQMTFFVPATILFAVSMSVSALSPPERTGKRLTLTVIVLSIFSIVAWWIFASLLKVNL
ncbi:MAG: tripartite tricarboxylate transporter TctB family protein [Desulfovibrio sp.]|nr:tripartite tricarboxylate transporter TctB family protein [Desulfovibrio sp.]